MARYAKKQHAFEIPRIEAGASARSWMSFTRAGIATRRGSPCGEIARRTGLPAVRALLRILEEKGLLKHREEGPRYVFALVVPREQASRSALQRVMKILFQRLARGRGCRICGRVGWEAPAR